MWHLFFFLRFQSHLLLVYITFYLCLFILLHILRDIVNPIKKLLPTPIGMDNSLYLKPFSIFTSCFARTSLHRRCVSMLATSLNAVQLHYEVTSLKFVKFSQSESEVLQIQSEVLQCKMKRVYDSVNLRLWRNDKKGKKWKNL